MLATARLFHGCTACRSTPCIQAVPRQHFPSLAPLRGLLLLALLLTAGKAAAEAAKTAQPGVESAGYALVKSSKARERFLRNLDTLQLNILEKLNRADRPHLSRLREIVVPAAAPARWKWDDLAYSPLPRSYPRFAGSPKALVVHQPWQVFGAYEYGKLVRWGPVSSGKRSTQTPPGSFHLNWRSTGRHSTVDPRWFMPWYFNFDNVKGLSLHEYILPGYPASHACVRLLRRDAQWLYGWGEQQRWDAERKTVLEHGTPLLIVDRYDFKSPPPWRSLKRLSRPIALPER